ncbi:MAG TPA: hypothetical protein VGI14_09975 [Casimicrobiaceae bacterium]|jgi:hypothetical protein
MTKHVKIGAVSYVDDKGRRQRIPASEGRLVDEPGKPHTTLLWWDDDGTEHRTPLSGDEYSQYVKSGQIVEITHADRTA